MSDSKSKVPAPKQEVAPEIKQVKMICSTQDNGHAPPTLTHSVPLSPAEFQGYNLIRLKMRDGTMGELTSPVHGTTSLYFELFSSKENARVYWQYLSGNKEFRSQGQSKDIQSASIIHTDAETTTLLVAACKPKGIKVRIDATPIPDAKDGGCTWKERSDWQ
jgi:hypothetical protein